MSSADDAFFDAYARCHGPLTTVRVESTPADMVVRDDTESEGWVEWKILPCEGVVVALSELERVSGLRLPPSFRRWYGSRHTLDMDVSVVRLPANPSNDPAGPLRERLIEAQGARARQLGLIPFGDEAMMDAGPLCFDPRSGGDPDAWPITYYDHEWAETEAEIGAIVFTSFDRLLAGCTAYMNHFAEVKRRIHRPDEWLDHRAECIRALLATDPEGTNGIGYEYWSAFLGE